MQNSTSTALHIKTGILESPMRYLARQTWLRWVLIMVMALPLSLLTSFGEGTAVADSPCDPPSGNPPAVPPGPCTTSTSGNDVFSEGGLNETDDGGT